MPMCKTCQKPIVWATTLSGQAIPLDPEPRKDGNIVLINGTAHYATSDALRSMSPRHVAHFVTCPNANGHRKSRVR